MIARWVPPLVFGAVWTALGVAARTAPKPMRWWSDAAPNAVYVVAVVLVVLAWPLRSWWLAVVGGLVAVLPGAPWNLDWFSYTTLQGIEMSRAYESTLTLSFSIAPSREALLPGLLLLAAALFGFLVRGVDGWVPLLGTGLGVLAFAVDDLVNTLNATRGWDFGEYSASHDPLPLPLSTTGYGAWPDLTPAAIAGGLLLWAFVRRDLVVATTAVAYGGLVRALLPPDGSEGMAFLSTASVDVVALWWGTVPSTLAPACVLLSGAVIAYLLRDRTEGPGPRTFSETRPSSGG